MAQPSAANTFGTFLETVRKLESTPTQRSGSDGWEKEVLILAKVLVGAPGPLDIKTVMHTTGLPQETFLRAMIAGRDRGLFDVTEPQGVPSLELTKLGRAIAE